MLFSQTLLAVLKSVLKHPVLEQWFLAVELDLVPPKALKPDVLRRLCTQMTEGVLKLLLSYVEALRALNALELLSPYLAASQRGLLTELQQSGGWVFTVPAQMLKSVVFSKIICRVSVPAEKVLPPD